MSTVEEMQASQSALLLSVLQIEMNLEATRESRLAETGEDGGERARLEEMFEAQRRASRGRIEGMVEENRRRLEEKVRKIVRHKKVADKVPRGGRGESGEGFEETGDGGRAREPEEKRRPVVGGRNVKAGVGGATTVSPSDFMTFDVNGY